MPGTAAAPAREAPVDSQHEREEPVGLLWNRSGEPPVQLSPGSSSPRGHPIEARAQVWVACRGRLIGRDRLASSLECDPACSDEDLIARGVARWGTGLASRLTGPVSWIVWDASRREIIAVADRLGLYPVFWASGCRRAAVAYGARAVADAVGLPLRPDVTSAVRFMNGRGTEGDSSFLAGVHRVEPGTFVRISNAEPRKCTYWSLPGAPDSKWSAPAAIERVRGCLEEVIPEYIECAPVAVALSGGLDSASVAVLGRASGADGMVAVTWTAPSEPAIDEGAAAAEVASYLGLSTMLVPIDVDLPGSVAPETHSNLDDPIVPFYAGAWRSMFAAVRQSGRRLLLTGHFGDNLFGEGTTVYADLLVAGRWRELARQISHQVRYYDWKLPRVIRWQILRPLLSGPRARVLGLPSGVDWLGPAARVVWRETAAHGVGRGAGPTHRKRLALLGDGYHTWEAASVARLARASGVELRHPLCDHRLVELAARLPPEFAFRGGQTKWILRQALQPWLPAPILDSRRKALPTRLFRRGFSRLARRLADGDGVPAAAAAGLVDPDRFRMALVRSCETGRQIGPLWTTLALEAWLRRVESAQ